MQQCSSYKTDARDYVHYILEIISVVEQITWYFGIFYSQENVDETSSDVSDKIVFKNKEILNIYQTPSFGKYQ